MTGAVVRFETGKTYFARSICDHNCIWNFEILRRSEKSVWVDVDGKVVRRGLDVWRGVEFFSPFGKYSMSALVSAEKTGAL